MMNLKQAFEKSPVFLLTIQLVKHDDENNGMVEHGYKIVACCLG